MNNIDAFMGKVGDIPGTYWIVAANFAHARSLVSEVATWLNERSIDYSRLTEQRLVLRRKQGDIDIRIANGAGSKEHTAGTSVHGLWIPAHPASTVSALDLYERCRIQGGWTL